jgi:uncharacterized membrane protein YeaQ/YmgE (transglycosylase-associated protein family)
MDVLLWLVVGLVAGVLALFAIYRTVPREPTGWLLALAIGVVGGVVWGWVADLLGLEAVSWPGTLVVAFAGAALLLWLLRRATGPQL